MERGSKVDKIYSIINSSKLTIWGKTDKSSITALVLEEGRRIEETKLSKNTVIKIPAN
jgi:hypothetical protein